MAVAAFTDGTRCQIFDCCVSSTGNTTLLPVKGFKQGTSKWYPPTFSNYHISANYIHPAVLLRARGVLFRNIFSLFMSRACLSKTILS